MNPLQHVRAIEIDRIRIDGGTQARVALDQRVVEEYRDAILAGANFPPVAIFFDGTALWLADGFHRLFGAKAAGCASISATVVPGSRRDAILRSLGANATHGLRRSSADKRKAIATMLDDPEWRAWSDRKIAEACGVSDKTVAAVRASICGNSEDVPTVRTVERRGKAFQQNTSKIGRTAPALSPAPAPALTTDGPLTSTATTTSQDNMELRALFSLPSMRQSASTALVVPELPPRERVTGDDEVDAMLWLQQVVRTGQPPLIAKAMEAAKLIRTPMKELGDRYARHIMREHQSPFMAAMATMGFGELEKLAEASVAREKRRQDALSRYGTVEAIFAKTPAEIACEKAMHGVKKSESWPEYADADADSRFPQHPALNPHTLADCLHVRVHSDRLYRLRHDAAGNEAGDHWPALQAHDDFAFRAMQRVPPRDAAEALAVLEYLLSDSLLDRNEAPQILRNLIGGVPRSDVWGAKPQPINSGAGHGATPHIHAQKAA